ncbi:hypothetical protein MMC07_003562 [Pseudocyphellaria aurata]|nr:hypothetical protein [Pseudocyphellaria aurata]
MADSSQARTRPSSNNRLQASPSFVRTQPTGFPLLNRLIMRMVSKILTWLGPSHRWISSGLETSLKTLVPLLLSFTLTMTALAASGNLLWTPIVLGATAILLGLVSVWSLTYWGLPVGLLTYLSVFGDFMVAVLVPRYGGIIGDGMPVRLYVILCSVWLAILPIVAIVSTFVFLCGRVLIQRNIPESVWPQQQGIELGMVPPPDSDLEYRRWTLSESYASPTHDRARSTQPLTPAGSEDIATVRSFM